MDLNDFEHGARFVNKLWNAARFLFRYTSSDAKLTKMNPQQIDLSSQWLLEEFARTSVDTNRLLNEFRINDAANRIYQFVWGSYCDWGLECAKESLNGSDEVKKAQTVSVLVYVFDGILRLLSPITPFVTEELWHHLPKHPEAPQALSLVVAEYPTGKIPVRFPDALDSWGCVQELVNEIRTSRALANIVPKDLVAVHIRCDQSFADVVLSVGPLVKRLAAISELKAGPQVQRPGQSLVAIGKGFEGFIPAEGVIDIGSEIKRLSAEFDRVTKILGGIQAKLANPSFADRAPEDVVLQTKEQFENMTSQLKSLRQNIDALKA
jgi:valyl-tRNA synthetase